MNAEHPASPINLSSAQPALEATPAVSPTASQGATARGESSRASVVDQVRHEGAIAAAILLVAVAFNLIILRAEVTIRAPALNDMVMHLQVLERTISTMASGVNLLDPWMGSVPALGYPLFHYYQHLPYLPVAAIYHALHALLGDAVTPEAVLTWSGYLLLSLFPLSVYWSMRRFGFARLEAAFAGLAASLVSTNSLYGFEYGSYVWRGNGMYTQLWGMLLAPMALGQGYHTLRTGRGYFWAVLLLAATVLSHLVSGYIVLGSLVLLALLLALSGEERRRRRDSVWQIAGRLALLLLILAVVVSYFLVPFVRDAAFMNRSVWELQEKYDSYGASTVLRALARGELLDFGRFPTLSLLAAAGLAVCLWRWRELRYRVPVTLALFWLLLYFGRPTWGALLNLLPLSENLHLHRLIVGFHLGSVYLAGIALALPWRWALASRDWRALGVTIAATALLLYPAYAERAGYLDLDRKWKASSAAAFAAEEADLHALYATLETGPPGRVYAGLSAKWGRQYTVGDAPMFALLTRAGFDVVGQLYQALSLNSDVLVLFDDALREQYDLFNIRYVLTPTDWTVPDYYTTLGDFGRHRLYEVPTTGYFDLVRADLAFAGDKSQFYPAASAWLRSALLGIKQHPRVYLGEPPAEQAVAPLDLAPALLSQVPAVDAPPVGRVMSETVESNAYAAQVEADRDGYVMLKATYHPDWRATVDGVETPTVMLMPSYVGVAVGPGEHEVRLEYRAEPMRGWLLLLGVAALVAVAVGEWWVGKSRRGDAGREASSPSVDERGGRGAVPAAEKASGGRLGATWAAFRPHAPYVGGVLLAALLAGLPLFQMKMMSGHDAPEYLTRAVEFYRGLQAGYWFPRWAPDLNFGYGEPFFNFNPPLIYYLMALFHALGASFTAAQNLASFAILAAAGLGMYLLGTALFGKRGGLVAAVAYLFAPYMLSALYVRQALADYSAFASIPYAFWAVCCFARDGRYRHLLAGSLAVTVLLLSANPIVLMTLPALVAWAGWLAWRAGNLPALLRGLTPIALGLGLSAFFWLPAFVERDLVQTANLFQGYLNYRNHFVYPLQFLSSPWGYGLSVAGTNDGMSFAIGPVYAIAALGALALLLFPRFRHAPGRPWLAYFLGLFFAAIFLASTWSQPIWDQVLLLQYLEFSWRFLTLVAFSSAVLCGAVFAWLSDRSTRLDRRGPDLLLAGVVAALLIWGLPKARPEGFMPFDEADHSPQAIAQRGLAVTTAGEYAPIWVQQRPQAPSSAPLAFTEGQGRVVSGDVSVGEQEYQVDVTEDARLRASTFYFPGWSLFVDGVEQTVEYDNPQGVMEFTLPAGQHEVRLEFLDTPVRAWARRLSLLAVGLLLVAGVAGRRRFRGRKQGAGNGRTQDGETERIDQTLDRARPVESTLIESEFVSVRRLHSAWSSSRTLVTSVGIVMLGAVLAGLPLFQGKMMWGHDSPFYLTAEVEFYRALQAGQLIPRWAPDLNFGFGEPFYVFRPPVVYYLMSLFRALGTSFVAAQNMASFVVLVVAGLGMYLLVKVRFGNRGGVVAAVAYLFAPYMLSALYVRQALHDFTAFAWIPFVFWGVYMYSRSGGARFLLVGAVSLALLMMSSNTVVLMTLPALGLWVCWLAWQEGNWRAFLRGLAAIALGLGLSAYFWLPAFAEQGFVQLARAKAGVLDYRIHFVYPWQFVFSPWGYGYSQAGRNDAMSFALGPFYLLVAATAVVLLWFMRGPGERRRSWLAFFVTLLAASLFLASTWSRPLWDATALLQFLQFSWRFLTLAAFSAALLCGAMLAWLSAISARFNRRAPDFLLAGFVAALVLFGLPKAHPFDFWPFVESDYSPQEIAARGTWATTAGEYAPVWAEQRPQAPAAQPLAFVEGAGNVDVVARSPELQEYRVIADAPVRMQANTFYFPGWTLYVDGAEQPIELVSPQGTMEFALPAGQHEVRLAFEATPVRTWAMRLSILSLLLLAGGAVVLRRMARTSSEQGAEARDGLPLESEPTAEQAASMVEQFRSIAHTRAGTASRVQTMLAIYLICFAVYFMSGSVFFSGSDQVSVYRTTQSLVERRDMAIDPMNDTVQGPDGRYYGVFGIGQSLASIPLYLLGSAVDRLAGPAFRAYWSGPDMGMWGGTVTSHFVTLFNQFITPLTCILIFLFGMKLGFSQRKSLFVTLVFAFGTGAWVYAREYRQHPLEGLALLTAVYLLFANRDGLRPRHALLAGLAMALGVLTRINSLLVVPLVLAYLLYQVRRNREPMLSYFAGFCAPLGVILLMWLGVNNARFGDYLAFNPLAAVASRFTLFAWVGVLGLLASAGRSIFLYSPPLFAAPFAFVRFWRAQRAEAMLFAGITGVYLIFYASFADWQGGWAWGPRYLLPTLPFLIVPLGYLLSSRRWAIAIGALAALGALVQILGVTVNHSFITSQVTRMNLSPETAYLWDPEISAIPMHLRSLLAGRNIDLWLVWVYQNYGGGVFAVTLALPLLLLAAGVAALWPLRTPPPQPPAADSDSQTEPAPTTP